MSVNNETTYIERDRSSKNFSASSTPRAGSIRRSRISTPQTESIGPSGTTDKVDQQKKPKKHGRAQYHCLDDVCILVRDPSSTTYISDIDRKDSKVSDASLEAYAKQAEERDAAEAKKARDGSDSFFSYKSAASDETYEPNADDYGKLQGFDTPEKQEQRSTESELSVSAIGDCLEFVDHVTFAKEFVEQIILDSEVSAEARIPSISSEQQNSNSGLGTDMQDFRESSDFAYIETKRSFTAWPTIETFTIETGAYKIDEYLASFETEEEWMYVIYYQGTSVTATSDLYRYQAIFSLPTWRYPIAQATASIYFTIEVCRVKPRHCEVDVTYKFETFGQTRKPGVLDFQEQWLHYILDSKIKFFKTVTY